MKIITYFTISIGISLPYSHLSVAGLSLDSSSSPLNRRQLLSSTASASTVAASFTITGTGFPQPSIADSTVTNITPNLAPSIALPTPSTVKVPLVKKFPLASFGLQIYDNDTAYKLTSIALQDGYRNFFASVLAGNQKGFAQAIRDSNIPRDELYICGTVLSNRATTYKDAYALTTKGCMENLNVMNINSNGKIEYLDMIMLDYPCRVDEGVQGQWDSFIQFQNDQHVAHLAVSNFTPQQLDLCLARKTEEGENVIPSVNQLPFSIANHPPGVVEENNKRQVHIQSWSPLSSTLPKYKSVMKKVGDKYGKSAAQVGLRWIVQNGGSYCVQSKKSNHFVEDLNIFDFNLDENDMKYLSTLSPPVEF